MKRTAFIAALFLLLYFILPERAFGAEAVCENRVLSENGSWLDERSAAPGTEILCRAVCRSRGSRICTARGVFSAGMEFIRLVALRQNGRDMNASYYTLTVGKDRDEGVAIHFSGLNVPGEASELEIVVSVTVRAEKLNEEGDTFSFSFTDADGFTYTGEAARINAYGFSIFRGVRVAEAEAQANPLSGACFSLYSDSAQTERIGFVERDKGVYVVCEGRTCSHTRHAYLLRTGETGAIRIEGLPVGSCFLRESRTPEGFTPTVQAMEISVSDSGEILAAGRRVEGTLRLLERGAKLEQSREKDPLAFYEKGCKVMTGLLAFMLAFRRRLMG